MTKSFFYSILALVAALWSLVAIFTQKDLEFWALVILSTQYTILSNQYKNEETVHNAIKSLREEDEL